MKFMMNDGPGWDWIHEDDAITTAYEFLRVETAENPGSLSCYILRNSTRLNDTPEYYFSHFEQITE